MYIFETHPERDSIMENMFDGINAFAAVGLFLIALIGIIVNIIIRKNKLKIWARFDNSGGCVENIRIRSIKTGLENENASNKEGVMLLDADFDNKVTPIEVLDEEGNVLGEDVLDFTNKERKFVVIYLTPKS